MERKAVSGIMLTLLLTGMLTLAFNIQRVKASGTIYIRPDGTVEGTDKIQRDGDVYTFTDNIYDSIVVEKDNIIIDGAGYILQGPGVWPSKGISLFERRNVTIMNIEIQAFDYGIYLHKSSNNIISTTNITNNDFGIWLQKSSHNTFFGNNIKANKWFGIWLIGSSKNNIARNTFASNGIIIEDSYENRVEDNTVNGKPLVYLEGVLGYTVEDAGQVIAVNCRGIRVDSLNLSYATVGVELWRTHNSEIRNNSIMANSFSGVILEYSSNNTISWNNITANSDAIRLGWLGGSSNNNVISENNIVNNEYGIYLGFSSNDNEISRNNVRANHWHGIYIYSSSNNVVSENTITDNTPGIYLVSSSNNNRIIHNNFINNRAQAYTTGDNVNVWDDGYPSGGNYWSDYEERYPNATEIDDSGIWDTPYVIDENNQDNYPLMNPWTPSPPIPPPPPTIATVDVNPDTLNLKSKGRWITVHIELPESYNVSNIDRSTILLNDTIPVDSFWLDKPLESVIGDYDNDGVTDLMVKFDRQALTEYLKTKGTTDDQVTLVITGEANGKSFAVTDTIKVIGP